MLSMKPKIVLIWEKPITTYQWVVWQYRWCWRSVRWSSLPENCVSDRFQLLWASSLSLSFKVWGASKIGGTESCQSQTGQTWIIDPLRRASGLETWLLLSPGLLGLAYHNRHLRFSLHKEGRGPGNVHKMLGWWNILVVDWWHQLWPRETNPSISCRNKRASWVVRFQSSQIVVIGCLVVVVR